MQKKFGVVFTDWYHADIYRKVLFFSFKVATVKCTLEGKQEIKLFNFKKYYKYVFTFRKLVNMEIMKARQLKK